MYYDLKDLLCYLAYKYKGDFNKIKEALFMTERINEQTLKEFEKIKKYDFVTIVNEEYPKLFKNIPNPPFVLFYDGNLELLNEHLPIGEYSLENGARFYSMVDIDIDTNEIGIAPMDYLLMCEDHNQMDFLLNHMRSKGIQFKSYTKSNKKKKDIERFH